MSCQLLPTWILEMTVTPNLPRNRKIFHNVFQLLPILNLRARAPVSYFFNPLFQKISPRCRKLDHFFNFF